MSAVLVSAPAASLTHCGHITLCLLGFGISNVTVASLAECLVHELLMKHFNGKFGD